MAKQNKPEQLELFDVDPICQQQGCMHHRHFTSIRELQALNEKLEEKLRAYSGGDMEGSAFGDHLREEM